MPTGQAVIDAVLNVSVGSLFVASLVVIVVSFVVRSVLTLTGRVRQDVKGGASLHIVMFAITVSQALITLLLALALLFKLQELVQMIRFLMGP